MSPKIGPGEIYEADLIKIPHHKLMTSANHFWHAEFSYSLVKSLFGVRFMVRYKVKAVLMLNAYSTHMHIYMFLIYIYHIYKTCIAKEKAVGLNETLLILVFYF